MNLILTPPGEQTTVASALQGLTSALREAESVYSLDDVAAMVAAEAARKPGASDRLPLEEAGGFVSWMTRYVTGADASIIDEIRAELPEIKSWKDKQDMLRLIDKLIAEVRTYTDRGSINTGIRTGLAAWFTYSGLRGSMNSFNARAAMDANHSQIISNMTDGLDSEDAAGMSQYGANLIGRAKKVMKAVGLVSTAIGAFALVRLIANIFRIVRRNNGSAQEYLDALGAVRAEVEAIKI